MTEPTRHPLAGMLSPASIALVGVSQNPDRYNGRILRYLQKHGYEGRIYLVNPRRTEIRGLPCYPSIEELPEVPELALLLVNMDSAASTLRTCAERGIPNVVVFAAGFAESVGDDSRQRERELDEAIEACKGRTRVLGPNCNGFVNYGEGIAAASTASLEVETFRPGGIGLIAQSAGIGMATIPTLAEAWGMGFRYIVSTGNEMDLEACDFMEYMLTDPNVSVIAAVIEGFKDGRRLVSLARQAAGLGKPIVILRTGRTEAGARAAASHTASISGDQRVFEAVCKQAGIVLVDDIDEMLETCRMLSTIRTWPDALSLGGVSMSGGFVTLTSDAAEENGLSFPAPQGETREALKALLPPFMEPSNPIDLTAAVVGNWHLYGDCLRRLADEPAISALVPILTVNELVDQPCEQILAVRRDTDKPMVLLWPTAHYVGDWYGRMWDAGIPVITSTTGLFRALRRIQDWRKALARLGADAGAGAADLPFDGARLAALAAGAASLGEAESKELLAEAGVPSPRQSRAATGDEARAAAERIGYPVVLKLDAPGLLHKTELGGVAVGLRDGEAVAEAFEAMTARARAAQPDLSVAGVLVQEMVTDGVEAIVGTTRDPQFGPVVMFGLGGVFTEVLEDVSLRLAPVSREEAASMIRQIKGFRVLDGYRGTARDVDALAETIVRVSHVAAGLADTVDQVEINPLFVRPAGEGVSAGDALIILATDEPAN